ncbi:MAG: carbohydrate kinase, partial [Clostridia bacterium]|nr:carbohydrate kinase [Clostridia bacterium]
GEHNRKAKEAEEATGIPEGTKVLASGSDKACETLGVGCINDCCASLSFGTTATIQTTTPEYIEPITFMPAYPAVVKGRFNPEVQIFRGYWMISWFKEQFAKHEEVLAKQRGVMLEDILDERLENIPAGCNGLLLQAFWTPGLKEPEGKGAIVGFTDVHDKDHIYRAIIEGIGFGLMDGLKAMEKKSKHPVKFLTVSGGGSSSNIICQITADMFGRPVKRVQTYETSGLGSAMATYLGLGIYESVEDAVEKMVHFSDCFEPNMEDHKIYAQIYDKVYSKMYKRVKPLSIAIRDIIKM